MEAARGPRSAADLHATAGNDVPLSSLYRTLTVLSESGVLARSHGVEGVALFELAEWLRGHHHHLVCIECGAVEDVEVGQGDEHLLGALAERVAGSQGFIARGHRIDVEGICVRCAA
jgi:Fur family ferric uptake transcriptional regulator